jgi:hypothetical protein
VRLLLADTTSHRHHARDTRAEVKASLGPRGAAHLRFAKLGTLGVVGTLSRMSTRAELRFVMKSGATAASTPRSRRCLRIAGLVTGSKHSAAVALIVRAGNGQSTPISSVDGRTAGVSWWRGDRAAETTPDRSLTEERLLRWACLAERRPRCCRSRAEASTVASFHVELGMSDDNRGRVDQAVCEVWADCGTRLASGISCRSFSHQTGVVPDR